MPIVLMTMKKKALSKEKPLQTKIMKILESEGWLVYKMPPLVIGFPDVMALRNGRAIFLEIKKEKGGQVGYFQAQMMKKLRGQGFTAEIIKTIDDFRELEL